jgi:hypothetical protein
MNCFIHHVVGMINTRGPRTSGVTPVETSTTVLMNELSCHPMRFDADHCPGTCRWLMPAFACVRSVCVEYALNSQCMGPTSTHSAVSDPKTRRFLLTTSACDYDIHSPTFLASNGSLLSMNFWASHLYNPALLSVSNVQPGHFIQPCVYALASFPPNTVLCVTLFPLLSLR